MIPKKLGERSKSTIVKQIGKEKIFQFPCKINLCDYVNEFKKNTIIKNISTKMR